MFTFLLQWFLSISEFDTIISNFQYEDNIEIWGPSLIVLSLWNSLVHKKLKLFFSILLIKSSMTSHAFSIMSKFEKIIAIPLWFLCTISPEFSTLSSIKLSLNKPPCQFSVFTISLLPSNKPPPLENKPPLGLIKF